MIDLDRTHIGDVRQLLPQLHAAGARAQCVVTSPPYWSLRDYGAEGQIGLEPRFDEYLDTMVEVFRKVRDLLVDDGVLWLNMGDSYAQAGGSGWQGKNGDRADRRFTATRDTVAMRAASRKPPTGFKPKDLIGQPWRLAFALQADGWWLRSDVIWHKPNPMPESITDRPTKSHEYLFLLSKSERYYYDAEAIKEPTSDDTHARYARGRSDTHKNADDGPGKQTIARGFGHMLRPKKPVAGWANGPGEHTAAAHNKSEKDGGRADQGLRDSTKFGRGKGWRKRKLAATGSGTKANESFDAAMQDMPLSRNKRTVWTIPTEAFSGAHFATFPRALVVPCVLAGSRPGDVVLDPFMGSGTVGQVALSLGRRYLGVELNAEYVRMGEQHRAINYGLALEKPRA